MGIRFVPPSFFMPNSSGVANPEGGLSLHSEQTTVYCLRVYGGLSQPMQSSEPHARGGAQRSGNGRQDGDGDVQNLLPDGFCFHFSFSF